MNYQCPFNCHDTSSKTDDPSHNDRMADGWVIIITAITIIFIFVISLIIFKKYKKRQREAAIIWRNTFIPDPMEDS